MGYGIEPITSGLGIEPTTSGLGVEPTARGLGLGPRRIFAHTPRSSIGISDIIYKSVLRFLQWVIYVLARLVFNLL